MAVIQNGEASWVFEFSALDVEVLVVVVEFELAPGRGFPRWSSPCFASAVQRQAILVVIVQHLLSCRDVPVPLILGFC
jgi:hypothetical protein